MKIPVESVVARWRRQRLIILYWAAGLSTCCTTVAGPPSEPDAGLAHRHAETMHSLRWRGVVRQRFDYSCGTGSVANFLALIGAKPPSEQVLIQRYAELHGPEAMQEAMKEGFSLLDLREMMKAMGYATEGVRYEEGTMPEDPHYMIVYLVVKGYRHFAVFAGTENGQVVLVDPSRGRIRLTHERFLSEWDGTALCLAPEEHPAILAPAKDRLTTAQEGARSVLLH